MAVQAKVMTEQEKKQRIAALRAELKELQEQARTDIDNVCLYIMDYTLDSLAKKGRIPDKDTVEAREFIIDKIRSKDGK